MTLPDQQARAVAATADFLMELARGDGPLADRAAILLHHYPLHTDLGQVDALKARVLDLELWKKHRLDMEDQYAKEQIARIEGQA